MMNTKITTKKTFSMRFRFLATLICAMFAITIVIGGLCLYEVDNYIREIEETSGFGAEYRESAIEYGTVKDNGGEADITR